ncbi:MAG: OmpA family protein [Cytophagales bacterium]
MARCIFILSILLGVICNPISAQNPKQTAKYKKKQNKREREKDYLKGQYKFSAHDSDGDGVSDYTDKCPNTPKGEKVTTFGCPYDTDFDGVYDYEDLCPNEKGPRENGGCPWGDADGDLIPDNEDECPKIAGLPRFKGCPDTDKDGVPDSEDACPNEFGPASNRGCPPGKVDTDGDGIFDDEDLCPKKFGPKSNRGCPDLSLEDKKALQRAFDNLLFETGKDIIVKSSYPSLNDLATILINNDHYHLELEGHTDNKGDKAKNLDLSKRRAAAVEKYLESKGVPMERVHSQGFGDTKPKADNNTEEGRKLNRRVEMNISIK